MMLWGIDEVFLFFIAIAIYLGVIEAGFRLGLRYRDPADDTIKAHVAALQTALLGLLALLLGFTFAMAVNRFEARKLLVLEESNAIGKAYWRSQLLPPEHATKIAGLLRQYVAARMDFDRAASDDKALQVANAAAARIERQIWEDAGALEKEDTHSSVTLLFLQSVNEMVDVNEKRLVALENHVPAPVHHLLFFVAATAIGFIAFGCGLTGRRRMLSTGIFAGLIAFVLAFILDIDQPRSGLIQVSQESMIRLQERLEHPAP
jgi:hypothetical protein